MVIYYILIEIGNPIKMVRLIKLCLTEMYSSVRVGKNLFDTFPLRNGLKQRDGLLILLFNFGLEHAFRSVMANQDGLKSKVHISFCFMLMKLIYLEEAYVL